MIKKELQFNGKLLEMERIQRKMTQKELGEAIQEQIEYEMDDMTQYVKRLETGKTKFPELDILEALANIFETSSEHFFQMKMVERKERKVVEKKVWFSGIKLRNLRKVQGYTQKEFASITDTPMTSYLNYEQGRTEPRREKVEQFANLFNVNVEDLFQQKGEEVKELFFSGIKLSNYRRMAGYSQESFAQLLGISMMRLRNYEEQNQNMPRELMKRMCDELQITLPQLFVLEGEEVEKFEYDKQAIGKRIQETRTQLGYSKQELVAKLGISKVETLTHWETGETLPKTKQFIKLATCLGISVQELIIGKDFMYDKI